MAWDDATEYMKKYREDREDALDNKRRQPWFATEVATMDELLSDKFDSDTENGDWESEDAQEYPDELKLQAHRIKVLFLARGRRDIKALLFGHDLRNLDRFEYMRLLFGRAKQELLKRVVKDKEAGAP
jgi:hypothetical protein